LIGLLSENHLAQADARALPIENRAER
jgi:hypothetical protein